MIIGRNRTLRGVRAKFAKKVVDGFYSLNIWIAPADEIETDMFLFRTYLEREYLSNINAILAQTIAPWRGTTGIDRVALV